MKVKVPDSWNEVSIGQFMEISGLDINSKDYALQVVSVLLDKDPEEIRKYDGASVAKIIHHLEWAMKSPDDKTYTTSIEVDGVEYLMIENLNSFTGGQWWDMEEYLNDYDNNIHNIFAMIYGGGKEYDAMECKKRGELFKEKVCIGQVYGSTVFFSLVAQQSMISMQLSLIQDLRMKHQKKGNNDLKRKKKTGQD